MHSLLLLPYTTTIFSTFSHSMIYPPSALPTRGNKCRPPYVDNNTLSIFRIPGKSKETFETCIKAERLLSPVDLSSLRFLYSEYAKSYPTDEGDHEMDEEGVMTL